MASDKPLDLEQELIELSTRIERLRVHYQQYFLGIEKVPPLVLREQLERRIRESPLHDTKRAVFKFRFQSLLQRLRTYEVYWDRLQRDIEEGRVTRGMLTEGGLRPARAGAVAKSDAAPESPEPPPLDPTEALYREFIRAREQVGLPVEGITLDAFRISIEHQRRIQVERLGSEDVAFSVVVKDGKVVLQARPVSQRAAGT